METYKNLIIKVTLDKHTEIKVKAALLRLTMTEYVLQAIKLFEQNGDK